MNRMKAIGKRLKREMRSNWQLYLMILPGVIFFFVLSYIPMTYLVMAFQDYKIGKGILGSDWIGFKHFIDFFSDRMFWKIIENTLVINISKLLICFPAPIILALCLNEMKPTLFKKVSQSILYLPHFLSWVMIYGILLGIFSADGGLVNEVLGYLGLPNMAFLTSPKLYKIFLIITDMWKEIGWGSIIYIAALAGISPELYEAAAIDGASRLKRLWHVSLPGISSTIIIMFILKIGSIVSGSFEQVQVSLNDAVYEAGEIIATHVYRSGLVNFSYAYSTAVGLFQSVISLILICTANKLAKKVGEGLW